MKLNAIWYINLYENEYFNKKYLNTPGKFIETRIASAAYRRNLNQNYNAILGYNTHFGKNNISAVGGFEYIDNFSYSMNASGRGATSDDFINLQYTTALVPEGQTSTTRDMSTYHTQERIVSGFINASYDYEARYLLSFSGRYDGYSKLIDNKWGFFPGVSAGWNIYKEQFMADYLNVISYLKIRAGYGQNGNVNLVAGPYDLQGNYGNTPDYNGSYGILINNLPYPGLRWEKTTSTDIAIDAGIYNNMRLSVGFFNKKTSDLLASVPLPTSSGVGNMLTNNGSVRTRGLELELQYNLIDTKNITWKIGGNATYLRSMILSLPDNGNENNRQGGIQVYDPKTGDLIWVGGYQEGQEYGHMYSYQAMHIILDNDDLQNYADYIDKVPPKAIYGPNAYSQLTDDQKKNAQMLAPGDMIWKDVNGDNMIDAYDQVKQGNAVPKWIGGINTSFKYNGLELYARFDYAAGYIAYNGRKTWYMGMSQGTFNTIDAVWDSWTEDNPDSKYPIYQYADQNYKRNYTRGSSQFYQNSSYLCAREITLSYSFPKALINSVLLQDLTLSLTGQNLFYLTSNDMYTPEYGANINSGYPAPRSVLFGLKAIF